MISMTRGSIDWPQTYELCHHDISALSYYSFYCVQNLCSSNRTLRRDVKLSICLLTKQATILLEYPTAQLFLLGPMPPTGGGPRMDHRAGIQSWQVHFGVFSTSRFMLPALSSDWHTFSYFFLMTLYFLLTTLYFSPSLLHFSLTFCVIFHTFSVLCQYFVVLFPYFLDELASLDLKLSLGE